MNEMNAEEALLEVLKIDKSRIPNNYAVEANHFLEHNESGLAYDLLVFGIQTSVYLPSAEALILIKHAATEWGGVYPNLSC